MLDGIAALGGLEEDGTYVERSIEPWNWFSRMSSPRSAMDKLCLVRETISSDTWTGFERGGMNRTGL